MPLRFPCGIVRQQGKAVRIVLQPWFSCFKRGIGDPVLFLIDTGSTGSFLSEIDAKRFGLDYSALKQLPHDEWVTGIGGNLPLYRITDECKLTFQTAGAQTHGKREFRMMTLDHFDVVKVEIADNKVREQILSGIPSILGMDILHNFRFVATNDEAYLED
ncbi:MAG: aspartyl protease family protein [Candidatus Bathyarchaeia archaeon]|jgi:hypothetical protein